MFEQWNPDAYYPNLAAVPARDLYAKGFRLVLLDIDNTLQKHGKHEPEPEAREQIDRFREAGFTVYILSNALPERAQNFGRTLPVPVIGKAGKPGTKGVLQALTDASASPEETLLIGDQLFTDIWSGTRAGVKTILVDPISRKEPWYIKLKRLGERFVKKKLGIKGYYDKLT